VSVGAATEVAVDFGALGALTRAPGAMPTAGDALPATMMDGVTGDFRSAPTRTSFGPAATADGAGTPPPVATEGRGRAASTVPTTFWLLLPTAAALSSAITVGVLRPSMTAARGPCPAATATTLAAALPSRDAPPAPGGAVAATAVASAPPAASPPPEAPRAAVEAEAKPDGERRASGAGRERPAAAPSGKRGRGESKPAATAAAQVPGSDL
jgi:hypothetical protein